MVLAYLCVLLGYLDYARCFSVIETGLDRRCYGSDPLREHSKPTSHHGKSAACIPATSVCHLA